MIYKKIFLATMSSKSIEKSYNDMNFVKFGASSTKERLEVLKGVKCAATSVI